MNELLNEAKRLYDAGLNVLPARLKEKRPVGSWKRWTIARGDFFEVFRDGLQFDALCVVCGPTSGGLEILDFDQKGKAFEEWNRDDFASRLVCERSQSGGVHVGYRCETYEGNQKLAKDSNGVLIETRGDGGICLIAPSPGYSTFLGDWSQVPTITAEERTTMFARARELDETPRADPRPTPAQTTSRTQSTPFYGESVADYVKRFRLGHDALIRAGWKPLYREGDYDQWQRPNQPVEGKPGASWNIKDEYFHVFTSNGAPFKEGGTYSHLQVIALLEFGGDVSAASKHYRKEMPSSSRPIVVSVGDFDDFEPSKFEQTPTVKPTVEAVEFPKELHEHDGLITEIAETINATAIRPQPEGATLAALVGMSYLAGRSVVMTYQRQPITPNLYGLFLAPSGQGKEAPRRVLRAIAEAYNEKETSPDTFASVQALQNYVARVRKVLWLHDEFGRDLQVMSGMNNNANLSGIITEALKLYSSASSRRYLPKMVAQEAKGVKRPKSVDRPALSIFATGNPREFYDATSEAILRNGYVARFTIVHGRTFSEKKTVTFEEASAGEAFKLPARIASRVKMWRDFESVADAEPTTISFTREAFDALHALDENIENELREDVETSDGVAEVKSRYFEKAWKYALLFAASKYGPNPAATVDRSSAEAAVALINYEAAQFNANRERFAQTTLSKLALDVREWARERGGDFSRSDFTRRFQRASLREREETLETLIDSDYIISLEPEAGKKAKFYRLVQ